MQGEYTLYHVDESYSRNEIDVKRGLEKVNWYVDLCKWESSDYTWDI